jgi:FkbM family methyltransferase
MLDTILADPKGREWLASLENPTRTRRGFRLYTLPGDLTSDWIKLHGEHETGTERFIMDHLITGCAFLDVGANIGYFSLLAALAGGSTVVAFEPQRQVADLLRQSVAHNHAEEQVRVECIALSDMAGSMRMTSCPGNTGHSQLAAPDGIGPLSSLVEVVVLDDWLEAHPVGRVSVCKIDTEGAEARILKGMAKLLKRDRPAIVIEVIDEFLAEFDASSAEILRILADHGYRDVSARYTFHSDRNRYFV